MKAMKSLLLTLSFLLACSVAGEAQKKDTASSEGKKLFTESKCQTCHGIAAEGMQKKGRKGGPPDLSTVGDKYSEEELVQILQKKAPTKSGKKHLGTFKGKEKELKTLSEWLASLKEGKKKGK